MLQENHLESKDVPTLLIKSVEDIYPFTIATESSSFQVKPQLSIRRSGKDKWL